MKSINWVNSIGQVVLIFIGVTVAMWFENWNNTNNDRKREVQLLKQMVIDLQNDLADLDGNKRSVQRQLESCTIILTSLDSNVPYSDSLGQHFAGLPIYTVFSSNVAAYQTLKGIGVDLIENDSIRQQIVSLYEATYSYMVNNTKIAHDYSLTISIPSLTRNFKDVDLDLIKKNRTATPVDYQSLKKNQEFIQQVRLLAGFQRISIRLNTNIIARVERLIGNIDAELKRLN